MKSATRKHLRANLLMLAAAMMLDHVKRKDLADRLRRAIDATLGRVAGTTLVDHFYSDAYEGFSARLGRLSDALGFRPPV